MYRADTIVAVATAPGRGGIGVVRLSGGESRVIGERLFAPSNPGPWRARRAWHGWLVDRSGARLDEALALWMPAPHSYTGEDVLELHGHGSPAVLRCIVEAAIAAGARLAARGEFTERAFLNGRLDLAQAEAVVDLIEARGTASAGLAAAQLHGALSKELAAVRSDLIDLKALLEVQIDFSEEDVRVDPTELATHSDRARAAIERLISTYQHGKRVRDGLRVVIAGRPNVGKSSLLNALLGEERAIVAAIAGTTRDVIEESIDIEGVPVVLSDTAGMRPLGDADPIEQMGIERTSAAVAVADVVLVVVDGANELSDEDREVLRSTSDRQRVIVANKADLSPRVDVDLLRSLGAPAPLVWVSARDRHGLDDLRRALAQIIRDDVGADDGVVLTNARHHAALRRGQEALVAVETGLAAGAPADIVAVAVQDALDAVGEVTGAVSGEDVLDRVFSRFCIGK